MQCPILMFNMSNVMQKQNWSVQSVVNQASELLSRSLSGQQGFLQLDPLARSTSQQLKEGEISKCAGVSVEIPLRGDRDTNLFEVLQCEETHMQLPCATSSAHQAPFLEDVLNVGWNIAESGRNADVMNCRHAETPKRVLPSVGAFTVQCALCLKWRLIPTKQQYEEIRHCILETPFVCGSACRWRPNASCSDPADLSQDINGLWAIDKPNIPCAPSGWERLLVIRGEGSTKFADIYYIEPSGKKLRSMREIERFLVEHPEYIRAGIELSQFSFLTPRPLDQGYMKKRKEISPFTGSFKQRKIIPKSIAGSQYFTSSSATQGMENEFGPKMTLADFLAGGQSERLQESQQFLLQVRDRVFEGLQANQQFSRILLDNGSCNTQNLTLFGRERVSCSTQVKSLFSSLKCQTLQGPQTSGCSTRSVQASQGPENMQVISEQGYQDAGNTYPASSVGREKGLQVTQLFDIGNRQEGSQRTGEKVESRRHSIYASYSVPTSLSLGLGVGSAKHHSA